MTETAQYRFLIRSVQDGIVELAWSQELDHHPVAVGTLQLRRDETPIEPLACEAQAYLAHWQRVTGRQL